MISDKSMVFEESNVGAQTVVREPVKWRCVYSVEKRHGDWTPAEIDAGIAPMPYEVINRTDNAPRN